MELTIFTPQENDFPKVIKWNNEEIKKEDAVKRVRKRVIRSYKSGEVWMYHFIYLLNDGTGVDMGKS